MHGPTWTFWANLTPFSLKGSGGNTSELDIHDDMLHEACRAAHVFLSGRFGMEDIELDPDFSSYWEQVARFKKDCTEDEDWCVSRARRINYVPAPLRRALGLPQPGARRG